MDVAATNPSIVSKLQHSTARREVRLGFAARLFCLLGLLVAEYDVLLLLPHTWVPWHAAATPLYYKINAARAGIVFFAALAALGHSRTSLDLHKSWRALDLRRVRWNIAVFTALFVATVILQRFSNVRSFAWHALFGVWLCLAVCLAVTAATIFFPWKEVRCLTATLWPQALMSAGLGVVSVFCFDIASKLWLAHDSRIARVMQVATLSVVRVMLQPFTRGVSYDVPSVTVSDAKFGITVGGGCSGIEGLGLMLLLVGGWLLWKRNELRMQRAIWLLPAALIASWLLNGTRIATLFLIGEHGYPEVAVGGFHSNAGWILFNVIAACFLLVVHRVAWFRSASSVGDVMQTIEKRDTTSNTAAIYLLPFLAILAASLLTQSLSSGFEWLYPLRFFAAGAALLLLRRHYTRVDWRFGLLSIAAGAGVFMMWLLLARLPAFHPAPTQATDAIASGLSNLPAWLRWLWIACRVAAATLTVPIAEELAFRGYLARRLVAEDVEQVSFRRLSTVAVLASSLSFGIMHGHMWLAGTLAGLVFAYLARKSGRLGDTVAAHATANLLIAAWVLLFRDYSLW